jgi:hypothetical protein
MNTSRKYQNLNWLIRLLCLVILSMMVVMISHVFAVTRPPIATFACWMLYFMMILQRNSELLCHVKNRMPKTVYLLSNFGMRWQKHTMTRRTTNLMTYCLIPLNLRASVQECLWNTMQQNYRWCGRKWINYTMRLAESTKNQGPIILILLRLYRKTKRMTFHWLCCCFLSLYASRAETRTHQNGSLQTRW